jgi:hypothetical protein
VLTADLIYYSYYLLSNVPQCGGRLCCFESLPLDQRHGYALFDIELHGVCSAYYLDNSIKYQNICHHMLHVTDVTDVTCVTNVTLVTNVT